MWGAILERREQADRSTDLEARTRLLLLGLPPVRAQDASSPLWALASDKDKLLERSGIEPEFERGVYRLYRQPGWKGGGGAQRQWQEGFGSERWRQPGPSGPLDGVSSSARH